MKVIYWLVAIVVSIPLVLLAVIYGASELGGEVVTLDRSTPSGETSSVRIWIVDDGNSSLIEHGDADSFWMKQLADSPQLKLIRGDGTANYVGTTDGDSHDLYHRLRREKYGWADQVVGFFSGDVAECQGIPVRLQSAG